MSHGLIFQREPLSERRTELKYALGSNSELVGDVLRGWTETALVG